MRSFIQAHHDTLGQCTVEALKKNRFTAEYISAKAQARTRLLAMIPEGVSVGFGGSTTIQDMDIHEDLLQRGCQIYDHNLTSDPLEKDEIGRKQLTCDIFLTSSNAITMDGKLYNMDGKGNRVAAMIFGPKQVIIVAGINKVVADIKAAEQRVQCSAAPINSMRVKAPNPCVKTGYCMDCDSSRRICNAAVTLHRQPSSSKITILLVGEKLGF